MLSRHVSALCLLAVLALLMAIGPAAHAAIRYVDCNATGANNGNNWTDAYTTLTNALTNAVSGDDIWVAQGTYVPGTNRANTFQLKNGVDIYGGFTNGMAAFGDRDWTAYPTILSGDVLGNDVGFSNNTENVYHVVKGANNATMDGFVIRGGKANGGGLDNNGGGMYNYSSSPTIRNCVFSGNSASSQGGGMHNSQASSSPTIQNCVFSGNSASSFGGGMYNSFASPTIQNCVFSGNSASSQGGGMYNTSSSSLTIQNCVFSGNSASSQGGGMCNSLCKPTIQNCVFSGNSAGGSGGGIYNISGASPTMTNCILWTNIVTLGQEIYNSASTQVISYCDIQGGWNGPFVTNVSAGVTTDGGGNTNADPLFVGGTNGTWTTNAVFNANTFQSTVTNTAATWTPGELAGKLMQPNTNQVYQYLIVTNTTNSVTIWGDFSTNALNGQVYQIYDYHLKSTAGHWETGLGIWTNDTATSPCIDAGDPAGAFTNEPSPNGWRINMGAYGNTAEASKSSYPVNNAGGATNVGTYSAWLNGTLLATGGVPTAVYVYWGTNDWGTDLSLWENTNEFGTVGVGPLTTNVTGLTSNTVYYYRFYATNSYGSVWAAATMNFTTLIRIYVDRNAIGLNNGSSWADAFTNLQDGLSLAVSNNDIWVAQGTYVPGTGRADTFQLKNGVNLYGGFTNGMAALTDRNWTAYPTILSGDVLGNDVGFSNNTENVYHVVTGANNATMDGFVIRGGNASGGGYTSYFGGGMYNVDSCSPTIRNCTFTGNSAGWSGGGMCNYDSSSPTIQNCTFSGNAAGDYGGGMYNRNSATPTIQNCAFSGNSGMYGGGMYNDNYSTPTIQNCVFSGNSSAIDGGGMYNDYSTTPTIQNCAFSGNSAVMFGGGMYNYSSSSKPAMTNCIVWTNMASSGQEIYNSGSTQVVSYCDIQGGWNGSRVANVGGGTNLDGGGNINTNPLFVGGTNGTWTTNAFFNASTFQSTVTNTAAAWTPGELAGKFVQPNTNQVYQYLIVTNTAISVTIWGDFSTNALSGKVYQIYDYHLKSTAGHWETGRQAWTNDTTNSPCIDAGVGAFANEPAPNGLRVNMGAYGNTAEASKSFYPVDNAGGATNISDVSACLNGTLLTTGGAPTAVYVYYGTNDCGTTNSLWANTNEFGTVGVGPLTTNVTGLTPNTLYYYRYYATNMYGEAWAPSMTNFWTKGLVINNAGGATGVTARFAWLNGNLVAIGASPTVTVYYGTNDCGTTNSAWGGTGVVGVLSVTGLFTKGVTGLTPETKYYYRCFATNQWDAAWAPATTNFTTFSMPQIDNDGGATNILIASAEMQGNLVSTGAGPTTVYIYWGTSDGGTNPAAWKNAANLDVCQTGMVSRYINELDPQTKYYYRCFATNLDGGVWAAATTNFTTLPTPASGVYGILTYVNNSAYFRYSIWDNTGYTTPDNGPLLTNAVRHLCSASSDDGGYVAIIAATYATTVQHIYGTVWDVQNYRWRDTTLLWTTDVTRADLRQFDVRALANDEFVAAGRANDTTLNNASWRPATGWQVWSNLTTIGANAQFVELVRRPGTRNLLLTTTAADSLTDSRYYKGADPYGYSADVNGDWTTNFPYATAGDNANSWYSHGFFNPTNNTSGAIIVPLGAAALNFQARGFTVDDTNLTFGATANSASMNDDYVRSIVVPVPDQGYAYVASLDIDSYLSTLRVAVTGATPVWTTINASLETAMPGYTMNTHFNWAMEFDGARGVLAYTETGSAQPRYRRWIIGSTNCPEANITNAPSGVYNRMMLARRNPIATNEIVYVIVSSNVNVHTVWWNGESNAFYSSGPKAWTTNATVSTNVEDSFACADFQFFQLKPPTVDNDGGASNITDTAATNLNGRILATGGATPFAFIYWGLTNGETVATNWAHEEVLGIQTNFFSTNVTGLIPNTLYYYRVYASNMVGGTWASVTTNFTTKGPPVLDNDGGASNITDTAALLNGNFTTTGGVPATAFIYYGTDSDNWSYTNNLGITNGLFSTNVTGLLSNQLYYYRCYATNIYGTNWATTIANFTTKGPPAIGNADVGATNIMTNSACLNGTLTGTGGVPTAVSVYWGTNDGGTTNWLWAHTNDFGTNSMSLPAAYATNVTNLAASTLYYYRYYATNQYGGNWAPATTNFRTAGLPAVDNDGGASNIAATNAWLNGNMITNGGVPATAFIYYGTNSDNWSYTNNLGITNGLFSTNVTGLLSNQLYYYRCYVTNIYGTNWAAAITNFTTKGPPVVDNGVGASNVTDSAAYMWGNLINTGGVPAAVFLYWGTNDGQGAAGAWGNTNMFGIMAQGPVSTNATGLTANTPYYYRYYATNMYGTNWASPSTNFITKNPGVYLSLGGSPFEENGGVATVTATLYTASASNVTVNLGFGGNAAFDTDYQVSSTQIVIAAWSMSGYLTITGLNDYVVEGLETAKVYIISLVNATNGAVTNVDAVIADDDKPPEVDNDGGASNIALSLATLNGNVTSTGGAPTAVYVYWGLTDGVTTNYNWGHTNYFGANATVFLATNVTGLASNTLYYYRFYATNMFGNGWAGTTTNFMTLLDTDGDGMPDVWEAAWGLNTNDASDAATDPDGDGIGNRDEYTSGTVPTVSNSALRIRNMDLISTNSIRFDLWLGSNRSFTLSASDNATNAKIPIATVTTNAEGASYWTDTNVVNTTSQRFYRIGVAYDGSSFTNRNEWAMFAQSRRSNCWYLVSVPVDLGASNNLNSTLGRQLARGLKPGANYNDVNADRLCVMPTNGGWNTYWLSQDDTNWYDIYNNPANMTVTAGMGLWVRRRAGVAPMPKAVFSGRTFTNAPSLSFTNSAGGWRIFSWPYAQPKWHYNGGTNCLPTLTNTPLDRLGFWQAGARGGATADPGMPAAIQADQIWVYEDNYWKKIYWLIMIGDTNYDGRWWDDEVGAFGNFALEAGKAYYYRTLTNFTWTPTSD